MMEDRPAPSVPVTPLEVLRERINRIVMDSLDDVEKTLRTGTPAAKASIMKTAIPALIKVLGEEQKSDELSEMRKIVAEMAAQDRAGIKGMDSDDPSTEGNTRGAGSSEGAVGGGAADLPVDDAG